MRDDVRVSERCCCQNCCQNFAGREETDLGTREETRFLNFAVFSAVEVILNCQEVKSTESGIQECEEFGFEGGGGDFAGGVYM